MPKRSRRRLDLMASSVASKASHTAQLARIRRRIDRLDGRLLRLLNDRASLALEIGRIKDKQKWPIYDALREAFVLKHVKETNPGPLSAHAVKHIFQAVLCECRRRQRGSRRRSASRK